jgi:hypothetical protein
MPRRRRNGKRNRTGDKLTGNAGFVSAPSRLRSVDEPFTVAGNAAVNDAAIFGGSSGISFSIPMSNVQLDVFGIGGRFQALAQQFGQIRIRKCRIRYRPFLGVGGQQQVLGPVPDSANAWDTRSFVFGFNQDPFEEPVSFLEAVQMGGKITTTDRNAMVEFGPTMWKFSELPGGASEADQRLCCFGNFYALFQANTTGSGTTPLMGAFTFEIDFDARYPRNTINAAVDRRSQAVARYRAQRLLTEEKAHSSGGTIEPPSVVHSASAATSSSCSMLGYEMKELHHSRPLDDEDWEVASAIALSMGKTQPKRPSVQEPPSTLRKGRPG